MSKAVFNYGSDGKSVGEVKARIEKEGIIERIWKKDYTIWGKEPAEIANRLGWLDSPAQAKEQLKAILSFAEEIKKEGFENALLLGMGGSSLAPEVFSRIFGNKEGFPKLYVLDSTHPDNIDEFVKELNPEKTLYIVSTKSGGTIETISFMKFFYTYAAGKLGEEKAGRHFVAITDPGSGLQDYAVKLNFREIFLNNPDIGGRFSAVSLFGLVPAAVIGADIEKLLENTSKIMDECRNNIEGNSGALAGVFMGEAALRGVDKLTFVISKSLYPFGVWAEQLIAESTGKTGKGILPIEGEKLLHPEYYGKDRLFVYLKLKGENEYDTGIKQIEKAGFPLVRVELDTTYELCGEFFRWEFATAAAGYIMAVQPFDQPNVESAKVLARETIKEYQKNRILPEPEASFTEEGMSVYTDLESKNIQDTVRGFLNTLAGNGYVSIQAYVKNGKEIDKALTALRDKIQLNYKTAVTVGIGPRFLHSTGQLHKGDKGNGLFIQLIAPNETDYSIPEEALSINSTFTFGILVEAQSLGDRQALLNNERKVLRIKLTSDTVSSISKITEKL